MKPGVLSQESKGCSRVAFSTCDCVHFALLIGVPSLLDPSHLHHRTSGCVGPAVTSSSSSFMHMSAGAIVGE